MNLNPTPPNNKGKKYNTKYNGNRLKYPDEYNIWRLMLERCSNPNNIGYNRYGGRGIRVCEEWRNDFIAFITDMGARPSSDYSLDRVDNAKGYHKGNCRWADRQTQALNKDNVLVLTVNGVTLSLRGWAKYLGIPYSRLYKLKLCGSIAAIERYIEGHLTH